VHQIFAILQSINQLINPLLA